MTGEAGVTAAVEALRARLDGFAPRVAIVLGSGLGGLVEVIAVTRRIPQDHIPGWPAARVAGHRRDLVAGTLGTTPVLVQNGRAHLYEGHDPSAVVLPVRAFARLGIETLIVTNAAGGIRATLRPGALMLIADHVNLMWRHPLAGPVPPGEARFPDMSEPYDAALRGRARDAARAARVALDDGVYAGVLGPSYETPAEIRMLERLGADAVGMSTVPEVIAARAVGLRCLGVSVIANAAAGRGSADLAHEDVLEVGRRAAGPLATVVGGVVRTL